MVNNIDRRGKERLESVLNMVRLDRIGLEWISMGVGGEEGEKSENAEGSHVEIEEVDFILVG